MSASIEDVLAKDPSDEDLDEWLRFRATRWRSEPRLVTAQLKTAALSAPKAALQLLKRLQVHSIEANAFHASAVLKAMEISNAWPWTLQLLQELPKIQVKPNEFSYSIAMSALRRAQRPAQLLALLDDMPRHQVTPNEISFGTAISTCRAADDWTMTLQLLQQMSITQLVPNVIIYSGVIAACGKQGEWQIALQLLNNMQQQDLSPDQICFSAVLKALKVDAWPEGLALLCSMRQVTQHGDQVTYNTAMNLFAKAGEWPVVLQLLDEMEAALLRADGVSYSSAVSACKGDAWPMALYMFRRMPELRVMQDVIAFNSAIDSCQTATWPLALNLLEEMATQQLQATVVSLSSAMLCCSRGSAWQVALALHDIAKFVAGTEETFYCDSIAINACEAAGHWALALGLFHSLKWINDVCLHAAMSAAGAAQRWQISLSLLHDMTHSTLVPSTVSFNTAMNSFRGDQWRISLRFLTKAMHSNRCTADAISFAATSELKDHWSLSFSLVASFAAEGSDFRSSALQLGRWDQSLQLLESLVDSRTELNLLSCNSIISRMGRSAPSLALQFLARLPRLALQPDVISLNAIMASMEWQSAVALLQSLPAQRLEAVAVSYSTCISACGRSSQRAVALELLREAVCRNLANQVVYNAAISACGGHWEEALALLSSGPLDEISLNSAINSCEKGGQWQVALHLLSLARAMSMSPSNLVIACNSALSAMDKCGQLQPALHLLSEMCQERLADEISFNCAIAACEKSKDWRKALNLLEEMHAWSMPADEISYRAAMSACPGSDWPMVLCLLDIMSESTVETGEISFNAALNALSVAPAATDQVALELLQRMAKQEVDPDAGSFKATANCCERDGNAFQSLLIFHQLGSYVSARLQEI